MKTVYFAIGVPNDAELFLHAFPIDGDQRRCKTGELKGEDIANAAFLVIAPFTFAFETAIQVPDVSVWAAGSSLNSTFMLQPSAIGGEHHRACWLRDGSSINRCPLIHSTEALKLVVF
eukprot:TRINITY_DN3602_c0_g1_i5.p2 TRINITY_DN3602_c0_g1~~TRINITY_DN3602_c0_g1_i5.p2  ORF type:complete len:118 (-),score=9.37 TRINITY_DN3602_c0_g1_i5:40-393(-)